MLYDIYFHNDFDGRASSAVMLRFLRERGDDIEHFTPVDFDLMPQWLDEKFFEKHKLFKGKRNPVIIVDFSYHPKATFWFDHHPTTFRKESWKKKFKPSKFHHYDPQYKSACHATEAALKTDFGWKPPRHFKELVKWLDILDGANYISAKQTLVIKDPALIIDAFIDENSREKNYSSDKWLIEQLAERPLSEIAKEKKITTVANQVRKEIAKSLSWCKKNLQISGNTGFIDYSSDALRRLRYVAFYLKPKLVYGIRLTKDPLYHLSVGVNPWRRDECKIHIGEMLKKYDGGGHKTVGGAEFRTHKAALKAIGEIIEVLNRK